MTELATAATTPTTTDGRITAPALVDVRWLSRHRDAVIVLDARESDERSAAHLPGARPFPLEELLTGDTARPALEQIAHHARSQLAACGVAPTDHVVLVDAADGSAALGGLLCELAGMRRVSVIAGSGIDAWRTIGGSLVDHETTVEPIDPSVWDGVESRMSTIAAFEDLIDAVVHGTAHVVDARSQLEHEGIVGSPCCAARGALPGSVHIEWTSCFDMLGNPRDASILAQLLEDVGIAHDEPIIVTCHAGHRAAIAARVLRSAGIRNVRVSPGSWHEWCGKGLGADEAEA